ncbi:MAG TPA: ferrous iron transport protein B [Ignavibacteria bacterium]|nr:ferrous iron transport protein B [Ignavibacteria bacterium]
MTTEYDTMQTEVDKKIPLITLLGHPNSGKTTLFNYLSGRKYKTVNYPGSTVEYSISSFLNKFEVNANILDSPGIISLIPCSPDEKLSVQYVYNHPKHGNTDIAIVTLDASQLSRHLLLVKQLKECNFKVIVALTMVDVLNKKGIDISTKKLSELISCDVVKIDGRDGEGVNDLLKTLRENISDYESEPDNKHRHVLKDYNKDKIINSYREIENIEKEVLFNITPKAPSKPLLDIDKVNENLLVLNNRSNGHRIPDKTSLFIDKIILHKFWGMIIFLAVMTLTFTSIFWLAAPLMDLIDSAFGFLAGETATLLGDNLFSDLIANGLIAGIGSVLVFLPQILILFLILGLLEDSGYLARGAMLVDKPLSKIGLNGRSFVPMLSGFACAIPAIMATRTISNKRERFLTIFIIPLMSCSARLPVYALLLAYLVPQDEPFVAGLALTVIYVFSIISSLVIAGIVNKFSNKIVKEKDDSSFIIELPTYKKPQLGTVLKNTVKNANQYVRKAGPVILVLSLVLWVLISFPRNDFQPPGNTDLDETQIEHLAASEQLSNSFAGTMGKLIQPFMVPLGLDWRVGVSLIATFAAREVFVSSMALIFKITDDDDDKIQESILSSMRNATNEATGQKLFTTSTICGLIVFFVFAMQCLSTVAISKKETGGWRVPVLQVVVFTVLAYVAAFITVNGLKLVGVS